MLKRDKEMQNENEDIVKKQKERKLGTWEKWKKAENHESMEILFNLRSKIFFLLSLISVFKKKCRSFKLIKCNFLLYLMIIAGKKKKEIMTTIMNCSMIIKF